jgi:hypothetical protein
VFRVSERTLTSAETEQLVARSRELAMRMEQLRHKERRTRIHATLYMVGFAVFFAAISVINLIFGHVGAAAAAALGVPVFGAFAWYVSRPVDLAHDERRELATIETVLSTNKVAVYEIEADAALVLEDGCEFESGTFGYVLRTDTDHYVYVDRHHCKAIDPEQLPSTRLVIEQAAPLVLRAEALGTRIPAAKPIGPIGRWEAECELAVELIELARPWPEVVDRLSALARAPNLADGGADEEDPQ